MLYAWSSTLSSASAHISLREHSISVLNARMFLRLQCVPHTEHSCFQPLWEPWKPESVSLLRLLWQPGCDSHIHSVAQAKDITSVLLTLDHWNTVTIGNNECRLTLKKCNQSIIHSILYKSIIYAVLHVLVMGRFLGLILSIRMLPSGCKVLHYTLHAQLFLQPQILCNRERLSCVLSDAQCLTVWSVSVHTSQ